MKTAIIAAVARNLAELDLAPEVERHAKLQQDLRDIAGARQVATDRRNAIGAELRSDADPRGDQVAAALIRGETTTDATRGSFNKEMLEEESAALAAGLQNLSVRERETHAAIRSVEAVERSKIVPAFQPLLDHGREEVSAALEVIAKHYAIARAVSGASGFGGRSEADAYGAILDAAVRNSRLMPHGLAEVPADVVALVASLQGRTSAHRVYAVTSVPNLPEAVDMTTANLIAAAVEGARREAAV